MIRLIDKTNARVGMVVDVRQVDNIYYRENLTIKSIKDDRIFINNVESYTFDGNYFSLVSMPERRRLTWEYAKSVFPNWPFRVWNGQYKEDDELWFNCANPDDYKCNFNDNMLSWKGDIAKSIFIDPPHPEIPEVTEPWLAKEEPIIHQQGYEAIGQFCIGKDGFSVGFDTRIKDLGKGNHTLYIKKEVVK